MDYPNLTTDFCTNRV